MGSNILVTGAAGYVGGSLVADFRASKNDLIKKQHIFAAVRSDEQAKALTESGLDVLQLDLTNEEAVTESLLRHNIHIVIHTASSLDPTLAIHLITALGKQREATGRQTYFIHTSGLSAFYQNTGWPAGETKDTGPVFEQEKKLADSFPLRTTDIAVIEHAKASGVTSFIVIPSLVYGKGSGAWNQLSVILPVYVQASISQKKVHKFAEDSKLAGVHISDLTALYGQIVEKILQNEEIPSGIEGYYFALAHDLEMWAVLDRLASALKARNLVTDSNVPIWSSDEAAGEGLGVPVQFVSILFNSSGHVTAEKPYRIGWKPTWDLDRFLQNIDDEIQAVLELGKAKSSLIDSLFKSAQG